MSIVPGVMQESHNLRQCNPNEASLKRLTKRKNTVDVTPKACEHAIFFLFLIVAFACFPRSSFGSVDSVGLNDDRISINVLTSFPQTLFSHVFAVYILARLISSATCTWVVTLQKQRIVKTRAVSPTAGYSTTYLVVVPVSARHATFAATGRVIRRSYQRTCYQSNSLVVWQRASATRTMLSGYRQIQIQVSEDKSLSYFTIYYSSDDCCDYKDSDVYWMILASCRITPSLLIELP